MGGLGDEIGICPAVVPVLVGPLQVLLTILPGLLVALAGGLFGIFKPSGLKNLLVLLWRQKVAVTCLTVAGVGLYVGAQRLWPRGPDAVVGAAQQGADWATARGDLRRCGAVPNSRSPTRAQLVWRRQSDDEGYLASPAVVGNRVYLASARVGAFKKTGAIHCIDADTGAMVWTSAPDNYRATFSSPVIAGDYLVCGEGLHDTRDARVICLNVRDKGKVVWTFRTKNHVECTPVIADGRVYVGAGDDGYYCLDLKPGPDGAAKVNWHLPTEKYPDAETSLAVHDGKVYAGLGNTGAALVVLDAATGNELHRLKLPYPVFSPASIADGKLYVGMGNGDYLNLGDGGEVRCLDLKTLNTLWTFKLPKTVLGAIAVKDDKLYIGCADGQVYCLARDGKQAIAPFNTRQPIKTSPAVTDQHVFVVNDAGRLFALDRHTFAPVWDSPYPLGNEGLFISSPVVARGHVYVGTQAEGLLCVGKPPSTKKTPHWFNPLGGPGVAGNSDNLPFPDEGDTLWLRPLADNDKEAHIAAPPALWDQHFFLPHARGDFVGITCLTTQKGLHDPPQLAWSFRTGAGVWQSPVVLGGLVACVDGQSDPAMGHGQPLNMLYFLDRLTGAEKSRHPVTAGATGVLTATPHQFLVQDAPGRLTSFDPHGQKQWSADVGDLASAPAANSAIILTVAIKPSQAVALDRASGAELWRTPLPHRPAATPLLQKRSFLLATEQGLELRDLINGKHLASWQAEVGVPSGELALAEQLVVFVNTKGELVAFDRNLHKPVTRVPGGLPGQTPLVNRGTAIYAGEGRLMSLALGQANATPELWIDLTAHAPKEGLPTGPLIYKDSRIFTILPGRGLACLGSGKTEGGRGGPP